MLLVVGAFVFRMVCIGLGLTMWEFRYGQPRREDEEARAKQSAHPGHARRITVGST